MKVQDKGYPQPFLPDKHQELAIGAEAESLLRDFNDLRSCKTR